MMGKNKKRQVKKTRARGKRGRGGRQKLDFKKKGINKK